MEYARPKKIFIVDDDELTAEAMRDYLTRTVPHHVTTFPTGEACLEHLEEEPDIIVLDYYLNSVQKDAANGMEILQAVKKAYPKVHVIMLSSQDGYLIAMQTIQKGAEQYVIKDQSAFEEVARIVEGM